MTIFIKLLFKMQNSNAHPNAEFSWRTAHVLVGQNGLGGVLEGEASDVDESARTD